MQPDVSVVIPTRDRPARLRLALASALAQQDVAAEVIVVDDGSAPDAAATVRELAADRARLIRHERSRGVSDARNAGIEAASAPWIAFLDDDDLWAPRKLATQLARAAQTGAGLLYTSLVVIDAAGAVAGELTARPEHTLRQEMEVTNAIGTPSSVMARADALRAVGGFDPGLSILADWDLLRRLLREAGPARCTEHLTAYTEHDSNMSSGLGGLRVELDVLAAKEGGAVGGAAFERWIAATMAREGARGRAARAYLEIAVRRRDPAALGRAALALASPRGTAGLRRMRAAHRVADTAWLSAFDRAA